MNYLKFLEWKFFAPLLTLSALFLSVIPQSYAIDFSACEGRTALEPNIEKVKEGLLTNIGLKSGEKPLSPNDVAIVFDIDGTLTDLPEPKEGVVPGKRPGAVELIQDLSRNRFNVVASSAWKTFHTPDTLRRLGLADRFVADPSGNPNSSQVEIKDNFGQNQTFRYNQFGNAVSVSDGRTPFFWHKALAPYIALGPERLKRIRKIMLVDDSPRNIQTFQQHLSQFSHLFHPDLIVDCMPLAKPVREVHPGASLDSLACRQANIGAPPAALAVDLARDVCQVASSLNGSLVGGVNRSRDRGSPDSGFGSSASGGSRTPSPPLITSPPPVPSREGRSPFGTLYVTSSSEYRKLGLPLPLPRSQNNGAYFHLLGVDSSSSPTDDALASEGGAPRLMGPDDEIYGTIGNGKIFFQDHGELRTMETKGRRAVPRLMDADIYGEFGRPGAGEITIRENGQSNTVKIRK